MTTRDGSSETGEPTPATASQNITWNRHVVSRILAASGTLLLAASIAALILAGRELLLEILIFVALALIFLAAIISVQRERPLVQALVYAGMALFLLSAVASLSLIEQETSSAAPRTNCTLLYAPTLTPTPLAQPLIPGPVGPTLTPTPGPKPTPLPGVEIAAKWPQNMDVSGSDFVGVTLSHQVVSLHAPKPGPPPAPTITVGGETCRPAARHIRNVTVLVATPIGVGTPGVAIEKAFGTPYQNQVSASAILDAGEFDVTPNNAEWQSLFQRKDQWGWALTPKSVGHQVVIIDLEMRWQATGNGASSLAPIQRRVWESDPIYIRVQTPLITPGQFNVSTVLSGVIATGLIVLVTALIAKFLPAAHGPNG